MIVTTLVAPAAEPVSLEEAKAYLRVGYDGEDDLVRTLLAAARARIEALSAIAMITRTLRVAFDCWPQEMRIGKRVRLPVRPAASLAAVRVRDANGDSQTVTDRFVLEAGRSASLVWTTGALPRPEAPADGIEIDYVAGFGTEPADMAGGLRLAVLKLAAHAYHHRQDTLEGDLPKEVAGLLSPWRRVRI